MAAIGTVWDTLTWPDDIWAEFTWGTAEVGATFEALHTLTLSKDIRSLTLSTVHRSLSLSQVHRTATLEK